MYAGFTGAGDLIIVSYGAVFREMVRLKYTVIKCEDLDFVRWIKIVMTLSLEHCQVGLSFSIWLWVVSRMVDYNYSDEK